MTGQNPSPHREPVPATTPASPGSKAISDRDGNALQRATKANRERIGAGEQKSPDRMKIAEFREPPPDTEIQKAARAEREKAQLACERRKLVMDLTNRIGARYAGCTLDNYDCQTADQSKVVARLREYAESFGESKPRDNIVLFGSVGTGKDHLLSALMLLAARNGHSVLWANGLGMFADYRDMIGSNGSERRLMEKYTSADVLCISDPIPPQGELTNPQVNLLFLIIEACYRNLRPIWCSMNTSDSDEAGQKMTVPLVDRLKDNALCLRCNWPSYRKPQ